MTEPQPPANPARPSSAISAALVVLCLVAYAPVWANDFIDLDDEAYVTKNPHVSNGLTEDDVEWAWTTYHAGYWLPLVWMSFQLDGSLSHVTSGTTGLVPEVYHGQNLFWHAATTVLLYLTFARMTGRVWPSALVGALFAAHPLHVESVAWATERKDVLSAFLWVFTMSAYARYVEAPSTRRYLFVLLWFTVGLLAKPMLVTLPCALLLLDYWPLRRFGWRADAGAGSGPGVRRILAEKVPLFLLAAAGAVMAVRAQSYGGAVVTLDALSVPSRLANAVVSYAWYVEKTFWPSGLILYYTHPMDAWDWPPVIGSSALLVVVSILALATARRAPWLLVGWLWFLGTLAPVIGFVQVGGQARGDRFVYIPHIGLFVAVVWSLAALADRVRAGTGVRAALGASCVLVLATLTFIQLGYWKDTPTIWNRALAVDPANDRAHATLGRYLMEQYRSTGRQEYLEQGLEHLLASTTLKPGVADYEYNAGAAFLIHYERFLLQNDLDEARKHLRAAIRARPDYPDALHNLGNVDRRRKDYPEAERALRRAVELSPNAADTRALYGTVLWETGRYAEARAAWEAALAINGKLPDALAGVGRAELREGRTEEAVPKLQAAVEIGPRYVRAWSELGVAYGRLKQWNQALAAHDRALKTAASVRLAPGPELAGYLARYAFALEQSGRTSDAQNWYRESIKMDPTWPTTSRETAWTLATSAEVLPGDAATAFELASEVCQAQQPPSAQELDTLAAACAATGRFSEAVITAREALKRATPEQAKSIGERLALYEAGKRFVAQPQQK